MPMYKLRRAFWDGSVRHAAGDLVAFKEGEQPSTAILFDGVKAAPEPEPPTEPELDLPPPSPVAPPKKKATTK